MTADIHDIFEHEARRRQCWPLRADERELPEAWLALLEQLHGQAMPDDRPHVEARH